jgi:hypothetical protein
MRGRAFWLSFVCLVLVTPAIFAQSPWPYPNAATDKLIHPKTPMLPPPINTVFNDPDFGSPMVRVTDETSNFKVPGGYVGTEASGESNMWSIDTKKFYVIAEGGWDLAFAFDPSTMAISSLPGAQPGSGLLLPLRPAPSFSFVDSDLLYGTTNADTLTISNYRFSTGVSAPVIDTRTCGMKPPLSPTAISDDDVTVSAGDGRISISEGGPQVDKHMFVIVYDKNLGCRWYNTQTGQIGGQWGQLGKTTAPPAALIHHAYISRSGKYVRIMIAEFGSYIWDVGTLNVRACPTHGPLLCAGYGVVGYDSYVNAAGVIDAMNILKRPLSNLSQSAQLVYPLDPPYYWGAQKHFSWSNVNANDSTPVCMSGFRYYASDITQPYDGEVFCVETDGLASTVWRFAHHRSTVDLEEFNTQPGGSISMNGRFWLFTSNWDEQVGTEGDGASRSDAWILRLD